MTARHEFEDRFPRASAVIREGIERGLHLGAQVYVSLSGEPVADAGLGEARSGVPMTAETINVWLSAGKPLTAVAIARLWEEGLVRLDNPLTKFIPEFGSHGKDRVTLRHVLTHTGGFRQVDTGWPDVPWEESISRICAAPLEPHWVPGHRAGYHTASSWFILGEILQRLRGRPFATILREEICEPLEMSDTWAAIPAERFGEYADRLAVMHQREKGTLQPLPWQTRERCASPSPGSSLRGPIRELGRFYEMLLVEGRAGERRLLTPQTVSAMTARHRAGLFDETFQHVVDFGLGFIIDSKQYGENVPYGYGRYCSPRTFGHGGSQSSLGCCDPERGLVVAFVFNGMPGEPQHNRRSKALVEAIYSDLQIA